MKDLIDRQAAIEAIDKNRQDLLSLGMNGAEHILVHYGRRVIENLLTDENDEWCDNCKEYDHNKHCCPRFNRVIRKTVEEVKQNAEQKWISCKERLPEVGRNVLLSVGKGLYTAEGELKHDGTWVQYRWSANIENVDAWAEMPEPWKGEEE